MTKKEKFMEWVDENGTRIIVGATLVGLTITTVVGIRNNCKYWTEARTSLKAITDKYTNVSNLNVGGFTLSDMGEFGKKYSEATGCEIMTAIKKVDLYLGEIET